ncbi:MAG: VOC family protein [Elusimicrobiota bacterium]|nr:MAG: VOC family protein [Elusimicrobiota bacterium]
MDKIAPCLWFDTQALEAAKFYVSVFKKGSRIDRVAYYTPGSRRPAGQVLIVEFTLAGRAFQALNGGPEFKFTEAVSLSVPCKTQKEIDYYWKALIAGGGKPVQCGWLKDKYGLSWQIYPTAVSDAISGKDKAKATRVMNEVMKMVKPDLKAIEKAAKG